MDEQQLNDIPEEEQESGYTPRPKWQVWLARICLVLFIMLIAMYYINMIRGGL